MTELAARIAAWWQTQMDADDRLKKADLFRRYRDLGSDKTFNRFLKSDFTDTAASLGDWHCDYSAVWTQIEELSQRQRAAGVEALLELSAVRQVRKAVALLTDERATRRVLLVTGESGSGKSCVAMNLQQRWGSRIVTVEVTNVWQDKPNRLLAAICEAVGMKPAGLPASGADKLAQLIAHLNATRTCLILEEGHHMGPQMLDTVKTLVNKTPGEFVIIAIGTLLRRLQQSAYEQARQVFASHRLAQTITLKLKPADALAMLTHKLGEVKDAAAVAAWLCEATRAPRHGNLGFIRDVADEVLTIRARTGDTAAVTAAEIQHAAVNVIEKR